MFIKDDICYAGTDVFEIKIAEVQPLQGRMLKVTFSNNEIKLYDTKKLKGSVFDCLDDESVFKNINIFHGFIQWCNGDVDVAPETIYEDSVPYNCDEVVFA